MWRKWRKWRQNGHAVKAVSVTLVLKRRERAHRKGTRGAEGGGAGPREGRNVLQGTRREPGKHFGDEHKSDVDDADIREGKPLPAPTISRLPRENPDPSPDKSQPAVL